jgi:hypothetical protein
MGENQVSVETRVKEFILSYGRLRNIKGNIFKGFILPEMNETKNELRRTSKINT